jgi:hypothetical protein
MHYTLESNYLSPYTHILLSLSPLFLSLSLSLSTGRAATREGLKKCKSRLKEPVMKVGKEDI